MLLGFCPLLTSSARVLLLQRCDRQRFNNNQIAVHDGKPIMAASETFTSYSRTNGGNVMLFQNTIISVKPATLKRAREE